MLRPAVDLVGQSKLEKVMGLTSFVFIASFSLAQGERNQIVNAEVTRPVNSMPMSTVNSVIFASELSSEVVV